MYLRLYFLFFGFVGLIALLAQFISFPNLVNYLSLFTILSNIAATFLFLYLGFMGKSRYSETIDFLFGAFVMYIMLTTTGYWVFLRNEPVLTPWINIVLHLVMPGAVVVGWIIHKHQKTLKYKTVLIWLTFPVLYLVYTLVRGGLTNWYPYPFLNPAESGGYGGAFIYVAILSIAAYLFGIATVFIGNKLRK